MGVDYRFLYRNNCSTVTVETSRESTIYTNPIPQSRPLRKPRGTGRQNSFSDEQKKYRRDYVKHTFCYIIHLGADTRYMSI